jgi:hypothetical protein
MNLIAISHRRHSNSPRKAKPPKQIAGSELLEVLGLPTSLDRVGWTFAL